MAGKTLVNGTSYDIIKGRTLVGGTGYDIVQGKTLVGGTGYDINLFEDIKNCKSVTLPRFAYWNSIIYGDGKWVIAGHIKSEEDYSIILCYSTDNGETWSQSSSFLNFWLSGDDLPIDLNQKLYFYNGYFFLLIEGYTPGSHGYPCLYISSNGNDWMERKIKLLDAYEDLTFLYPSGINFFNNSLFIFYSMNAECRRIFSVPFSSFVSDNPDSSAYVYHSNNNFDTNSSYFFNYENCVICIWTKAVSLNHYDYYISYSLDGTNWVYIDESFYQFTSLYQPSVFQINKNLFFIQFDDGYLLNLKTSNFTENSFPFYVRDESGYETQASNMQNVIWGLGNVYLSNLCFYISTNKGKTWEQRYFNCSIEGFSRYDTINGGSAVFGYGNHRFIFVPNNIRDDDDNYLTTSSHAFIFY